MGVIQDSDWWPPPIQKEKGRVKKYAPETTPNVYKEEDVAEYEKRMLEILTPLSTDDLEGQAAAQLEKSAEAQCTWRAK